MTRFLRTFPVLTLAALLPLLSHSSLRAAEGQPRIAIIKADDLRQRNPKWDAFLESSRAEGVKVSIGIICDSLEKPAPEHTAWLRELRDSGQVEFWNHGWDHRRWKTGDNEVSEFSGSGAAHQEKHFRLSQDASQAVFGAPFSVFGAPFNGMDLDAFMILKQREELTAVFCYGKPAGLDGKLLLPMTLRGEHDGTGKPNAAKFQEAYHAKKGADLPFAALQFHPAGFKERGLEEYVKIIRFLKTEGWTFMLPSEYAASQNSAERGITIPR